MPARDLAIEPPAVTSETTIVELSRSILASDPGCAAVTEDDEVVGLVTKQAVVRAVANDHDSASLTAGDLIESTPDPVDGDALAAAVIAQMDEQGVRHLPVVDDEGFVGTVTLDEVVATVGRLLNDAATVIQGDGRISSDRD